MEPDILIVGSSRALQGVDPQILKDGLAERGYPGLKVYNFGINGATAQVVDWVLLRLLSSDHMPRLIIWADGSRAFNSGRIDHTFRKIASSPGYQLLNTGRRSPFPKQPKVELGSLCVEVFPDLLPALKPLATPPASVSSSDQNSSCQQPLKLLVRQKSLVQLESSIPPQTPEELGFQVVKSRFVPETYFRQYPRVSGVYDADYRDFTLEGKQTQALERVTQFAKRRSIPLVVVNLPLTPFYLDGTRIAYEQQFRSRMQRWERAGLFIFQDLARQPRLSKNQYFADPSHINREGAIAVARQISNDLQPSLLNKVLKKNDGLTNGSKPGNTNAESSSSNQN
jgi:hypothetical protein